MFEVSVEGRFTAAHQLALPAGALEPLHEHAWRVRVTYAGAELNESGLLVDFGVVRERLAQVLRPLEGQNLNRVAALGTRPPSAEVVAQYIAQQLAATLGRGLRLNNVEVEEERGCRARYFPSEAP